MTLRTYRAWTWDRWLIWGGGGIAFWVVAFLLINTPYSDIPTWARSLALVAPMVWSFAAVRLYQLRARYGASIAFVTKRGISVHVVDAGGKALRGRAWNWVVEREAELDQHVKEVATFWFGWRIQEDRPTLSVAGRIADYLNGTHIEVVVTDEPIVNRRHNIKAAGLAYPKRLAVSLTPDEVDGDPPRRFWGIVDHELGHACLDALGVATERHHDVMHAAGWEVA